MKRRLPSYDLREQVADHVAATQVAECRFARRAGELVYFIQCGDEAGPVKIGYTRDLPRRLIDLQIANPFRLRSILEVPGDERYELALHKHFAASHLRGEWFEYSSAVRAWVEAMRALLQREAAA